MGLFHRLRLVRKWLAKRSKPIWELWEDERTGTTRWYNTYLPLEETDQHPCGKSLKKVRASRLKLEDYRPDSPIIIDFTPMLRK